MNGKHARGPLSDVEAKARSSAVAKVGHRKVPFGDRGGWFPIPLDGSFDVLVGEQLHRAVCESA
jgi:hypothetical protein